MKAGWHYELVILILVMVVLSADVTFVLNLFFKYNQAFDFQLSYWA